MGIVQKVTSLISIKNEIKQYVNNFENKQLLNHLLVFKFEIIEKMIDEGNIEKAREEIDVILCTKEILPEELENKLKFLKGNIELELNNYTSVKNILQSLKNKDVLYYLELQYKYALQINDESLMESCVKLIRDKDGDEIECIKKKLKFYIYNKDYQNIIIYTSYIEDKNINDGSIFYYIASAYLATDNFSKAKKFANKAKQHGLEVLGTYVYILAETSPLLKRRGIMINILEAEKKFLNSKCEELTSLLDKLPDEIKSDAILKVINLYTITDMKKAKDIYYEKESLIQDSIYEKYVRASIETYNENYILAKEIYLEILDADFSEEIMINITGCMNFPLDYSLYISLFEKFKDRIVDSEFILTKLYLESIFNVYGIDEMRNKIEKLEDKYKECLMYKIFLLKYEEDKKIVYKQLKKIEDSLDDSNKMFRLSIADLYLKIDKFDDFINVTRPLLNSKNILIMVMRETLKNEKKEYFIELIKKIDEYENDLVLMKYKIDILFRLEEKNEAKQIAEEVYKLEKNHESLQRLIQLKLIVNDTSNLEELINKLIPSKNPMDYMRVACGYQIIGDINQYHLYSYEAIFMTEGIFDKDLYKQFVYANFRLAASNKENFDEINKVKEDMVITLENDKETVNICLNTHEKYQVNKEFFGCIHISRSNPVWLELIEQNVGDSIIYKGEIFKIKLIEDKNIVIGRYCFSKLDLSDESFGMKPVDIDEFPIVIKEISKVSDNLYRKKIEMYELKYNQIGLPFSKIFYGDDLKLSIELINTFLLDNNSSFHIGMPKNNKVRDNIVLSYQTLLILENYNILDLILLDNKKYYVSKSLRDKIYDTILMVKRNKIQRKVGYSQERDILYKNEIDYSEVANKLKKILSVIDQINIKEINLKIRDEILNKMRIFISDEDIDNILLAKELNATLIIDDRFTRSIINNNEYTNNIDDNNIYYFLKILFKEDLNRYYNTLNVMLENNVKYVLDKDSFKYIFENYKKLGYDMCWFKRFISNIDFNDYIYKGIIMESYIDLFYTTKMNEKEKIEFSIIEKELGLS